MADEELNGRERGATPDADIDSLPIEKCFEELEIIVAALESQDASLEESLRLYERGMRLSTRCSRELNRVEKRIQVIVENSRMGELEAKEFRGDDAPEGESA